ncbi:PfkB family carbohydrate kinase [Micromonospora olivasterospora]|uniref:Fructoselysine 6-kinase n=1 Tax=Micromonospora olivasterospora TaxID=1880 RepID=A0A562I8E0_MICOL|nr:PfkB family carbohydrate kinase [Micromonospora olivasterospora]TWH67162.1 fructoselysine 6-kinase [Micromonospora olivasterospora]
MSTGRQPWVAVVGDNCVDRYRGSEDRDYSGGNAFNVAVQLARAGVAVRYFGAVGTDALQAVIRSGLEVNGISTDDLTVLDGPTAVTEISVAANGDRIFDREDFGVTADYFPTEAQLDQIAEAVWVHIGMLPEATRLRKALAGRITVSQDCAVATGLTDLDVAFLSAGETGDARELAAGAAAAGVGVVVATRGAEGSVCLSGDRWYEQAALPAIIVDTTGAGDSFIAGFIAARLSRRSLPEALETGARFAAAACAYRSGWPHLPLDKESR